jgi:DNA repair protein RadD
MKLRDYQQNAVDAIFEYFAYNNGNPLLVLPTGAGKSLIIGYFIKIVIEQWPSQRIMQITHVKELIEQNYLKLMEFWQMAPAGIYSASFNSRDTHQNIIFGGIQSVYNKAFEFGKIDLLIIDEAHLVPTKSQGMYRKFIANLQVANPKLKIIGLTATHYRLDSGLLTDGKARIFTDVAYELPLRQLIDEGYLSPLRTPAVYNPIDLTGVRIKAGEFSASDMENAVHRSGYTEKALVEILKEGSARRSWLIFCPTVEYANEIATLLNERGIKSACVTGETEKSERDRVLRDYKAGKIRAITNCSVLTTGFDAPATDMLVLLNSTKSVSRYVQIMGRGMRLSPDTEKKDCLVLDFGGNIERHGPVDTITVRSKSKGGNGVTTVPTKKCPECRQIVSVFARTCTSCAYEFPFAPRNTEHDDKASRAAVLSEHVEPEWLSVANVSYQKHIKPGKTPSLKVTYQCGLNFVSEWVCLEHFGKAQGMAIRWWSKRSPSMPPPTIDLAIDYLKNNGATFKKPARIEVRKTGKFSEIIGYDFENITETRANAQSA